MKTRGGDEKGKQKAVGRSSIGGGRWGVRPQVKLRLAVDKGGWIEVTLVTRVGSTRIASVFVYTIIYY